MERNIALLEQTMRHIQDHPETHDQSQYFNDCGTPSCFAGWAIHLAGHTHEEARARYGDEDQLPLDDGPVIASATGVFAAQLLGLTHQEALIMFYCVNARDVLALMVKDLVNGDELKAPKYYAKELMA